MKSLMIAAICALTAFALGELRSTHRLHSAPTYYLAGEVSDCELAYNYIAFRGASNLPPGARVTASVADFNFAASTSYSNNVYVSVDDSGFFSGKIIPRQNMHFRDNLILVLDFTTFRPKQPEPVLAVIGRKGEKLAEVPKDSMHIPDDLEWPAVNPQLIHNSGGYVGLETIARVVGCGKYR